MKAHQTLRSLSSLKPEEVAAATALTRRYGSDALLSDFDVLGRDGGGSSSSGSGKRYGVGTGTGSSSASGANGSAGKESGNSSSKEKEKEGKGEGKGKREEDLLEILTTPS